MDVKFALQLNDVVRFTSRETSLGQQIHLVFSNFEQLIIFFEHSKLYHHSVSVYF